VFVGLLSAGDASVARCDAGITLRVRELTASKISVVEKMWINKAALFVGVALPGLSASTAIPLSGRPVKSLAPSNPTAVQNQALAREITRMFDEDQVFLADLSSAKENRAFQQMYMAYVSRVKVLNFRDPMVYEL
jgi:hypothetical protein